MKTLNINGQQFQAEKIVKTDANIVGYVGENEVFAFRGISDFSSFTLEDGQNFDTDELAILKEENQLLQTQLAQQSTDFQSFMDLAFVSIPELQV